MKNKKISEVVVQFNMDIIGEILSRLRVKDLTRLKAVCKSWLQLISSEGFIQLHLNRSSFRPIPLKKDFHIECCYFPSGYEDCAERLFSGSCNGLVCLFDVDSGDIHIRNPAIRSSACFPTAKAPGSIISCFWFGHHDDEYKLVLGTCDLVMHVIRPYANSSYNWESTQIVEDCYCGYEEIGTLFNGNVHWPVCEYRDQAIDSVFDFRFIWAILSYDLHQEKARKIVVPADKRLSIYRLRLGVVDGCLSALFENDSKEFELWAMKDYGFEESWTKLMVLGAESPIPFRNTYAEEVVLDDPEKIKSPLYAKEVYVESLISP